MSRPEPRGFSAEAGSTWITAGSALHLESSLSSEPITLNGDGVEPASNGHNTGALVNDSSTNTYNGTLTLNTNSTIGVAAGLIIDNSSGDGIINPPGAANSLTKEGSALVLNTDDTYQGNTYVNTGTLELENDLALGGSANTVVSDGAQLELSGISPLTIPSSNTLYLTGVGVGITDATTGDSAMRPATTSGRATSTSPPCPISRRRPAPPGWCRSTSKTTRR